MDCHWNFSSNTQLELVFISFDTEVNKDTVSVYDGDSTSSPLIGQFSGSSLPPLIYSSSNKLYVTFKTDGSNEVSGFTALYRGGSRLVSG